MPKPIVSRFWAVPTLIAALLLSCVAATPAQAADRTSQTESRRVDRVKTPKLVWVEDEEGNGYSATVKLPRDYDRPKDAQVSVALFKVPAADPARRIGTLFLNPGGPGGSGVDIARAATSFLSQSVLDRFDIVGFDPRGTNASSRVRCFSTSGRQGAALAGMSAAFPNTGTEEKNFIAAGKKLASGCSGYGSAMASSMSTAEVARDLDVLRRAVGDAKLNYLGFSYGSYLGAVYANMFPDRFRAMVIDGVLDPLAYAGTKATRSVPTSLRIKSAEGSWKALSAGLAACAAAGPGYCPLASPRNDFDQVAAALKASPKGIPVYNGSDVLNYTYAAFISDVLNALYYPDGMDWVASVVATLKTIVTSSDSGTVTTSTAKLNTLVKGFHRVTGIGMEDSSYDNSLEAYSGVMCTDTWQASDPNAWIAANARAAAKAPYFSRIWGWSDVQCATNYWKAKDEDVYRGGFGKKTASPVMIVGNYYDPATNYAGAEAAKRLMPKSYLVKSDSWGHTAYGTSDCVTDRVDGYLLDLAKPAESVCVGNVKPFTAPLSTMSLSRTGGLARVLPTRQGLPPVTAPAPETP
ncbi:MAG TPA: alpha/beta hydrolase [Propionicimonas sp.]|jgi:pimeloyl-ACP methyl ester carboxylesterase|uniref:alpha/beta hydrolase n=1 Tax=Propionicimonas sp. TaxID=1955623 RepID=UPI002F4297A5